MQENYTDPRAREVRSSWAGLATFFACVWGIAVNGAAIWVGNFLNGDDYIGAPNGQIAAAILLAVAIMLSETIFVMVGTCLTEWQNFQYQQDFDQSFGFKLFCFNFWTKFFSIFFAFSHAQTKSCR